MITLSTLYNKETIKYADAMAYSQKSALLKAMSAGNVQGAMDATEEFLRGMRQTLGETPDALETYREYLQYTWIQLNIVAESVGFTEKESTKAARREFSALEKAKTADRMDELCRRLVFEYTSRINEILNYSRCSPAVRAAIEYIRENLREPITVKRIADAVHFSEGYLSHKFSSEMGVTVMRFVSSERIKEAEKLLLTDKSISDIAEELCFSSQSHFTERFREETGMTPSRYRRRCRETGLRQEE